MNPPQIQMIKQEADIQPLRAIMAQLVGQKCWQTGWSYGEELRLDLGGKIPYQQKVMAGQLTGEWNFGARATPWTLQTQDAILIPRWEEDDSAIARAKINILENTTVTQFDLDFPSLTTTLVFDDQYQLVLFPELDDLDLAYWELFMPDECMLDLGPGAIWSYHRSDILVSELAEMKASIFVN